MQIDVPTKPWWQSLTLWVNLAAMVLAGLTYLANNALALGLSDQMVAWITAAALGLSNILLRFRTSQPIGPEGGTKTIEAPFPKEIG